jgi:integrase
MENESNGLSLNQISRGSHRHKFIEQGNHLVCECGKKILNLHSTELKGLRVGKKSDDSNYSVREDRRRYFYPFEWKMFIDSFEDLEHKFFFNTLLHTGGRIMEVLNLKHEDINVERGTIKFSIVKQRKAKREFYAIGKSRAFFVAENFIKEYKSFIRGKTINPKYLIFLDNKKLPSDYDSLDNSQRKKYYQSKVVSYSNLMRRKLKKLSMKKDGIKDWYNFSPHNIRKTYGMWMRTFGIDSGELCYRLGHDIDTYIAHYGSSLMFTEEEKRRIRETLGEVKIG